MVALIGVAVTAWIYNRKKNYWRSRYLSLAQMDHDDELPHTGLDRYVCGRVSVSWSVRSCVRSIVHYLMVSCGEVRARVRACL